MGNRAQVSQLVNGREPEFLTHCLRSTLRIAETAEALGRLGDDQGITLDEAPAPASILFLEHLELPHT